MLQIQASVRNNEMYNNTFKSTYETYFNAKPVFLIISDQCVVIPVRMLFCSGFVTFAWPFLFFSF